jgi:hypothetical protein
MGLRRVFEKVVGIMKSWVSKLWVVDRGEIFSQEKFLICDLGTEDYRAIRAFGDASVWNFGGTSYFFSFTNFEFSRNGPSLYAPNTEVYSAEQNNPKQLKTQKEPGNAPLRLSQETAMMSLHEGAEAVFDCSKLSVRRLWCVGVLRFPWWELLIDWMVWIDWLVWMFEAYKVCVLWWVPMRVVWNEKWEFKRRWSFCILFISRTSSEAFWLAELFPFGWQIQRQNISLSKSSTNGPIYMCIARVLSNQKNKLSLRDIVVLTGQWHGAVDDFLSQLLETLVENGEGHNDDSPNFIFVWLSLC